MSTVLHVYVIYSYVIVFGAFVPIAMLDMWLRSFLPHMNRTRRGKYTRWLIRTFQMPADHLFRLGWLLCIATPILFVASDRFKTLGLVVYWTFIGVVLAVDWITGSDDPPYKRWVAEATKKLKISTPPKPAIDLR